MITAPAGLISSETALLCLPGMLSCGGHMTFSPCVSSSFYKDGEPTIIMYLT